MSITAKLYNRLLLNRIYIRDTLEKILHFNQAGFLLGRGCVEQIHLLHRMLQGVHKYAAKLINPENCPLPHEICTLAEDRKAWRHMEVDCWYHWEPP